MINRLLLSVIATGAGTVAIAQNTTDSLLAFVNERLSGYPSETVYLQTSKGIYETGEDIWFKAYELDTQSFGLSNRSKTLYLQMVNDKDSVVWQEKYPIENGTANGHVYVDDKLQEGNYSLEGYTRHSFLNDTIGTVSLRKIKVIKNIAHTNRPKNTEKGNGMHFEVFPEGGNLVSELPCRPAFKATDDKGYPVDVEGTLYRDESPAATFKSYHDGMGFFFFTPSAGKKYRIELSNGQCYSLPEIYPQGMTLRLSGQNQKQLEFVISQSESLPPQEIYLLGQMRGMVCCVAKGKLKNNLKITIPLTEFPYQGIAEFTLFNKNMHPVAERLVYVHPEKKLTITIEQEKDNYTLREKVTLKIKVRDSEGKPVQANLGISVFDKAYQNPADPVTIFTHCYLSSQIRGKIHNPAYYFNEENKDRTQAMDILLLTQGWRRYVWNVNTPICYGEMFLEDEISGTLTTESKKRHMEIQNSEQLIQVSGAERYSTFVSTDLTGRFTINTDMMKELRGGYVYVKPMLSKKFKPVLEITNYFPQINSLRKNKPSYYPLINLSATTKEQALDMPIVSNDSTILLDEVVVTRKARRSFRDKFMGRLDSLAQKDLNNIWVCSSCGLLLNYKQGYDGHHAVINGCPAKGRTRPIDGQTYTIAKYEHFESGTGGIPFRVIDIQDVVYHAPQFSEEELLRLNNIGRTKGYYAVREFYQSDETDMQLSTPDARNTLLWQPSIITNEKGEATVSFFCSDINAEFISIVEGVDGRGLLGNGKCEFRVVRKIE